MKTLKDPINQRRLRNNGLYSLCRPMWVEKKCPQLSKMLVFEWAAMITTFHRRAENIVSNKVLFGVCLRPSLYEFMSKQLHWKSFPPQSVIFSKGWIKAQNYQKKEERKILHCQPKWTKPIMHKQKIIQVLSSSGRWTQSEKAELMEAIWLNVSLTSLRKLLDTQRSGVAVFCEAICFFIII